MKKQQQNTHFPSKKSARFLNTKTGQTGLTVPPFADLARSSPGNGFFVESDRFINDGTTTNFIFGSIVKWFFLVNLEFVTCSL